MSNNTDDFVKVIKETGCGFPINTFADLCRFVGKLLLNPNILIHIPAVRDLQARLEKAEGLIKTQRTLIEHQDDRIAEIVACKNLIQGQLTAANNLIRNYRQETSVLTEYLTRIKVSLNWGDVHDVKSIIAQATQFMKDKKIPHTDNGA